MKEEDLLTGKLEPTNEPHAIAKVAGIKMCASYNLQYGTRYRAVMPTNLYGPGDNYHVENSHVIPAMIRKYHLARLAMEGDLEAIQNDKQTWGPISADIKEAMGLAPDSSSLDSCHQPKVIHWGSGQAYREFLHVDDMAAACIFLMNLDRSHFTPDPAASEPRAATSFVNIGTGKDQAIAETARLIQQNKVNRPDSLRRRQAGRHTQKTAGYLTDQRAGLAAGADLQGRGAGCL